MDGMLSQEEINALLGGMGEDGGSDSSDTQAGAGSVPLSSEEKDAIGEISNISMGTAATTLSTLLNQKVLITTPNVSIANWEDISQSYDRPCVFIQISYIEGLDGNNILILREKDVKIITDLMMGGNGEDVDGTELSELHLSAICEAMNQMMGSAATSISSVLEKKVDISPPTASLIDMDGSIDEEGFGDFLKGEFVKVSFRLEIGTLIDSELMQLYPIDFAKELYNKFMSSSELDQPAPAAPTPAPAPAPAPAAPTPGPAPAMSAPPQGYAPPMQPAQPVNPETPVVPATPVNPRVGGTSNGGGGRSSSRVTVSTVSNAPTNPGIVLGESRPTASTPSGEVLGENRVAPVAETVEKKQGAVLGESRPSVKSVSDRATVATGDYNFTGLWASLFGISLASLAGFVVLQKKKEN